MNMDGKSAAMECSCMQAENIEVTKAVQMTTDASTKTEY